MRERLKPLHLLRQVRERGCHARLKLRRSFGVSALPNFVLASCNEEGLLGAEATFSDSSTILLPQFGGRVSKTSRKGFSTHKISPFKSGTAVVPQSVRSGTTHNVRKISS